MKKTTGSLSIALVMPFFDPALQFGGPVIQAYEVCRRLSVLGHRVSVVTTDIGLSNKFARDHWIDRDGFRVFYVTTNFWNRLPPYYCPGFRRPLAEVIPKSDIVYLRVGLTVVNDLATRIAMRSNVPYIYNAEGCLCPERLKIKFLSKWLFLRVFERRILARASRLHACTVKEASDYTRQGADDSKIDIIPNGVEIPVLETETASAERFRHQFSIPDGPIVLYMGRLTPLKGPEILLKAFLSLPSDLNAQLVFAGSDWGSEVALRQTTEAAGAKHRVHFVGNLNGEHKQGAFRSASLFALISYSEGLPNAVLEALSFGLPCVVSRNCNVDAIASHGAGAVVSTDHAEAASAINETLSNAAIQAAQSIAARNLAQSQFHIESVIASIEASFRDAT